MNDFERANAVPPTKVVYNLEWGDRQFEMSPPILSRGRTYQAFFFLYVALFLLDMHFRTAQPKCLYQVARLAKAGSYGTDSAPMTPNPLMLIERVT